jgi:xylulokinase
LVAFERAALAETRHEAGQNLMLPFFGPEITPRHDFTGPVMRGSAAFESGAEPALQVRALLEGQFLNMRLHSQWMEVKAERIRLTGGASKNNGIAQLVADVFQAPVERLDVSNSAALGAALIAAARPVTGPAGTSANVLPGLARFRAAAGPALAPVYEDAMERFEGLLRETCS